MKSFNIYIFGEYILVIHQNNVYRKIYFKNIYLFDSETQYKSLLVFELKFDYMHMILCYVFGV